MARKARRTMTQVSTELALLSIAITAAQRVEALSQNADAHAAVVFLQRANDALTADMALLKKDADEAPLLGQQGGTDVAHELEG